MSAPADDLETLAALHALGLLRDGERDACEARLRQEAAGQALVETHTEAAALLAELAPPRQPPPALRDRLLARVRAEAPPPRPSPFAELAPGIVVVHSGQLDWQETGLPGIRIKRLHVDPARNQASSLVSMVAGSVYPRHWHVQAEELLMLSGRIVISGYRFNPGDYCRADGGTLHEDVLAETDCTFLAMGGLDNEFRPVA